MSLWTVTLEKPGREDKQVIVGYLAPKLELPVDRLCVNRGWQDWHDLPTGPDLTIFIETYVLTAMNPDTARAWASFRSLRRSHELYRKGDPSRLPA